MIDDGSDIPLSKSFELLDPRIRIIVENKNRGAQYARNIGIKSAKGMWVAFIDSDDEWLPKKLEHQLNQLKLTGYKIAVCDGYIRKDHNLVPLNLCSDFTSHNITKQLLTKPSLMLQGLLAEKSCFEIINYLDENAPAFHEWDTIIRLSKSFPVLVQTEKLFIYNTHQDPSITKNIPLRKRGYMYVLSKHIEANQPEYNIHLTRINSLEKNPYLLE